MAIIEHMDPSEGHARAATSHAPRDPSRAAFCAVAFRSEFSGLLSFLAKRSTLDAAEIFGTVNGLRALLAWRARGVHDGQAALDAVNLATPEQLAAATRLFPASWELYAVQAEDIARAIDAIDLFRRATGLDEPSVLLVGSVWDRQATTQDEAIVHAVICLAKPLPDRSQLIPVFPEKAAEASGDPCCDACAHGTGACEGSAPALDPEYAVIDAGHPDVSQVDAASDPWLMILRNAKRAPCASGNCQLR